MPSAKIIVGSFTAKGLIIENKNELSIINEGSVVKAVKNVKDITFSPIIIMKENMKLEYH